MTRGAKAGIAVVAFVLLLAIGYVVVREVQAVRPVALPIERTTTYITEPLDSAGRVDYAAALNRRQLPPAAENAAILLIRVVGTDALAGDLERLRALLGAPADLPARGALEPMPEEPPFFQEIEDVETEEEREAFRAWVARNEEAAALLEAASRRPELAWPIVRDSDDNLLQTVLPYDAWTKIVSLLQARADLHLVDGRWRDGWSAAQTQQRLALLLDDSPVLLWRLIAWSTWSRPLRWVGRALAAGALDEAACEDIQRELQALQLPRSLDNEVLRYERLALLDAYIHQVAKGIRADGEDPGWHAANVALTAALREINRRFDDVETKLRPTPTETLVTMREAAKALRAEVESLRDELKSASGMAGNVLQALVSGGAHQGRLVGVVLSSMVLTVLPVVIERTVGVEAHRQLVLVALALRIHERRAGAFPAALGDLESGVLPDLSEGPLDLATVTYERTDAGCILTCRSDVCDEEIEIVAGTR